MYDLTQENGFLLGSVINHANWVNFQFYESFQTLNITIGKAIMSNGFQNLSHVPMHLSTSNN